jgi:hypothetical protein
VLRVHDDDDVRQDGGHGRRRRRSLSAAEERKNYFRDPLKRDLNAYTHLAGPVVPLQLPNATGRPVQERRDRIGQVEQSALNAAVQENRLERPPSPPEVQQYKRQVRLNQDMNCMKFSANYLYSSVVYETHTGTQIPIYVFLFWELRGLGPNPHSSICERFISSQDWFTYFLQQNRQIDRGNI